MDDRGRSKQDKAGQGRTRHDGLNNELAGIGLQREVWMMQMVQVAKFGVIDKTTSREAGVQMTGQCAGSYDKDHDTKDMSFRNVSYICMSQSLEKNLYMVEMVQETN
jgi:hypothetical protein